MSSIAEKLSTHENRCYNSSLLLGIQIHCALLKILRPLKGDRPFGPISQFLFRQNISLTFPSFWFFSTIMLWFHPLTCLHPTMIKGCEVAVHEKEKKWTKRKDFGAQEQNSCGSKLVPVYGGFVHMCVNLCVGLIWI